MTVSGTGLVLSYLSHFDSSRRDPANSRRSFTNVRRLPVCGLCLTVEIHVCIYVSMCVCVCVGGRGGGAEVVHGVWEQDKQGVGSPNASTSGAVASSSSLPSTLGEKTGTPSVQLGLQQCPMYSFHELLLHFRVMRVELCFWCSCMHNSGKEGIKSLQSVPKDVKVLFLEEKGSP